MISKIELLAPAGSKEALNAAIGEGADAVYLGLKDFNARKRAKNFSYKEVEAAIDKIHTLNKKIYITLNTVIEERETKAIYNILKYLSIIKPNALIVQDLGIIKIINDFFPDLKIHASTQMNTGSISGINLLSKLNVSRIVLPRELSFEQIKNIRQNTNEELEIFAHGALCISASGLCLFSSYIGGRSANRGACAQPCRKLYNAMDKTGYYFSTKDLMLIEYIPQIADAGINCIKIEGRMRSADYVGPVVRAYRYVIDNYKINPDAAITEGIKILQNDFARNKTSYYFFNKKNNDLIENNTTGGIGVFLGQIKKIKIIDNKKFGVLNTMIEPGIGDVIRINENNGNKKQNIKITEIKKEDGVFLINITDDIKVNDNVYLTSKKNLSLKYPHIIPKSLNKYKHHPSISEIPVNKKTGRNIKHFLKHGNYIRISYFKDLYIIQAAKPEKIIVDFTKNNIIKLKAELKRTVFKADDIIIYLNPYFTNDDELILKNEMESLVNNGFKFFIANNIGQIGLLKHYDVNIISGPYIYAFNSFTIKQLDEIGVSYFLNPLENNKKNLVDSSMHFKDRMIITLFVYPELFQIQTDLYKKYNFNIITDKFKNNFSIIANDDKTIVLPEKPFSIIDKALELKKEGFNKFMVDLSYMNLNKNTYKNIIRSLNTLTNPPNITRFNWKNGFYRETSD